MEYSADWSRFSYLIEQVITEGFAIHSLKLYYHLIATKPLDAIILHPASEAAYLGSSVNSVTIIKELYWPSFLRDVNQLLLHLLQQRRSLLSSFKNEGQYCVLILIIRTAYITTYSIWGFWQ